MGQRAADKEVRLGGGRQFGVCCCFYDGAAPRKEIAANTDGAMLGK